MQRFYYKQMVVWSLLLLISIGFFSVLLFYGVKGKETFIDLNVFSGSLEEWSAFIGNGNDRKK